MNQDAIRPFSGGTAAQRDHLNKLVDRCNELTKEVQAIKDWPEQKVVVRTPDNETSIIASVKSIVLQGEVEGGGSEGGNIDLYVPYNGTLTLIRFQAEFV